MVHGSRDINSFAKFSGETERVYIVRTRTANFPALYLAGRPKQCRDLVTSGHVTPILPLHLAGKLDLMFNSRDVDKCTDGRKEGQNFRIGVSVQKEFHAFARTPVF